MKLQHAAVIGHPIGHTMSPFIHKRLFALEGRSVAYQVLDVPDLSASLPALRSLDCFNARAMAFEAAVRQRDLDLTVACRESSQPKAVALAQEVAAFLRERGDRAFRLCVKTYEELEEESLPGHSALGFDLLLNATSVGM